MPVIDHAHNHGRFLLLSLFPNFNAVFCFLSSLSIHAIKNDDYATMLRATAPFFFDPICTFFFSLEIRNLFRCLCVPFLRFLSPPPQLSCCCFSELIRTHSNAAFVLPATNVSPLSFLNLFFFQEEFLPSLFVRIAHIHSERKLRLPCCAAFSFLPTYLLFSLFPLCLLFFFCSIATQLIEYFTILVTESARIQRILTCTRPLFFFSLFGVAVVVIRRKKRKK